MANKRNYKRSEKYLKVYVLYKDEETIAVGTIAEIMEQTGYTEMGLRFFGTPCYAKRTKNGKRLILLED